MSKVVDISNEIFQDLSEPSDIGISSISMKVRSFIGELNLLINSSFSLNSSYEIVDENNEYIDVNAVAILKKLYEIYYYGKNSNSFLGAAGIEVKEVSDDNATVISFDKGSLAKTYLDLKKTAKEELQNLVNGYKIKKYAPVHVESDDKIGTVNNIAVAYKGYLFNGGL